jgi:hypothetical protein
VSEKEIHEKSDMTNIDQKWVQETRDSVNALLSEVECLESLVAANDRLIAEQAAAMKQAADIMRGLRKCRHGRTCCAENDNTIGAINAVVKVFDALPTPPSEKP